MITFECKQCKGSVNPVAHNKDGQIFKCSRCGRTKIFTVTERKEVVNMNLSINKDKQIGKIDLTVKQT